MNNRYNKIKSSIFLLLALFMSFHLVSFKAAKQALKIDYFGEISLPDEMEIQAGSLKELTDAYGKTILGNLDNHQSLVFQQKGLNSADPNSFKTYARVVIDTYMGEKGTYKQLSEKNNLTNEDISFYKSNFETQLKTIWPQAKQKLISSTETVIIKVGNHYCTKHSYIRQLENSPQVFVEVFRFQNNDRVHLISFSYRTQDETKWKNIMDSVLKSIKLTKF